MNQTPTKREWFDPTVNLGHVLTFIGFIAAGGAAWATLDKRLTIMEETRGFQRQVDTAQDQRALDSYVTVKETLSRIDRTNERIADRLDKIGVK